LMSTLGRIRSNPRHAGVDDSTHSRGSAIGVADTKKEGWFPSPLGELNLRRSRLVYFLTDADLEFFGPQLHLFLR
jgi:hypothetical protein